MCVNSWAVREEWYVFQHILVLGNVNLIWAWFNFVRGLIKLVLVAVNLLYNCEEVNRLKRYGVSHLQTQVEI